MNRTVGRVPWTPRAMRLAVLVMGICLVTTFVGWAETNLVDNGTWVVDGIDDAGTNPRAIDMTVSGQAVGAFSELRVSYNVGGTGVVAVCVIKGSGAIQLAVPSGDFGGSFYLTGYWDCEEGFIPGMAIEELDIRLKASNPKFLQFRGTISNLTSLEANDFTLRLFPPQPDAMRADASYKLTATRDFCVDQTNSSEDADFFIARTAANFLSPSENENDEVRYSKLKEVLLDNTNSVSFCANLVNEDGFIFDNPKRLGTRTIFLVHQQPLPRNTPTLTILFRAPSYRGIKPQGYVIASVDPTEQNVSFWGNWNGVKKQYQATHKFPKFKYTMKALAPREYNCKKTQ